MTDHDPLRGRDPYPRDRLDLLPLLDARQELLEEIVSDVPARSRALVPVGIAAAIAVIAGAAWFATTDDGGRADDPVAAAGSESSTAPARELRTGDVVSPEKCRTARSGLLGTDREIDEEQLATTLAELSRVMRLAGERADPRSVRFLRAGGRLVAVDEDCVVLAVGR